MKNLQELKELRAEKLARVQAIIDIATDEKRDLSQDEKNQIDSIQGSGKPGEATYKRGELDEIDASIDRIEKVEARAASILGKKVAAGTITVGGGETPRIVVPARAKAHGKLKAFAGADASEQAYVAGRWWAAHMLGDNKSRQWLDDHGIRAALSTDNNEKGGIFVPTEMETAIIRLVEQYGVFRQYAQVTPMGSDRKVQPVRTGGMTAYPVAETNTANEGSNTGTKSEPSYTNIELVARKWKAWLKMSDELNEDAIIQMADQVAVESALAFAYAEDNAGFNGDGTSTYHGIRGVLNAVSAGSVYTAATGNTAFSTLDLADFEGIAGQLPDYPGITPAWFISKEGYFASMHRLQMAAGGNTSMELAEGGRRQFLGYPVVFANVLNKTLTTQTSTNIAVFGDLRMGALFGDRRQMTMSLTDQRYWDEDQIAVKATERFDINIHDRGGSTAATAGSILVLATPGS